MSAPASTNTIGYLDAAMASPDVPQDTKDLVRQGAAHVDRSARWYRKNRFHELTALQQDAILRGLERDIRIGLRWLRAMLVLTLEGFLCDPVHGGNRDMVGWKMIGFPGAHLSWFDQIENHNQPFEGDFISLGQYQQQVGGDS